MKNLFLIFALLVPLSAISSQRSNDQSNKLLISGLAGVATGLFIRAIYSEYQIIQLEKQNASLEATVKRHRTERLKLMTELITTNTGLTTTNAQQQDTINRLVAINNDLLSKINTDDLSSEPKTVPN